MKRPELLLALGVGLAAFVAYLVTLYPSVPGGDSGEIIGAIAAGGVIHPPGYPLFGLLGRLFLHLPMGSVAWRINLLSAACDAAAAGVLAYGSARWTRSLAGGLVAGGLFAFSPGIWQYAISAEVFALNNLTISLLVLLAVLYAEQRQTWQAMTGALCIGLGMANHHTVVFTAAPLALWVLWVGRRELLRPTRLLALIGCVLLGLLPYATLPLLARHRSPISWGQADTWSGFWTHVLRREYGTFQLSPTGPAAQTQAGETLTALMQTLQRDFGWWWLALAAWGFYEWGRRWKSGLAMVLLVPPLLSVGVLCILGNLALGKPLFQEILARFWQQPEIYICLACGWAIASLAAFVPPAAALAAAAAVVLIQLGLQGPGMNHRTSTLVRSYGSEILRAAPPNALLITKGDLITSTLRYLQLVEGYRSDVKVVDQELLSYDWYRPEIQARYPGLKLPDQKQFTAVELLSGNFGRQPTLVCGGLRDGDASAISTFELWPFGLCDSVHPRGGPPPIDLWIQMSDEALPKIEFGHEARPPGSWEEVVWEDYWAVRLNRAIQLLDYAGRDPERRGYIEQAVQILSAIRKERPDPPPMMLRYLAIASGRAGLETPEQRSRTADAWRAYLRVLPPDDPQLPTIEAEVSRLEESR